jgi:hypothetical protein
VSYVLKDKKLVLDGEYEAKGTLYLLTGEWKKVEEKKVEGKKGGSLSVSSVDPHKAAEKPKLGADSADVALQLKVARLKLNESELKMKTVIELFKSGAATLEDVGEEEITVARHRIVVDLLIIVEVRTKNLERMRRLFEVKGASQRDLERASQLVENARKQLEHFRQSER